MSQDIKNVMLAGAGGNLGPFILEALTSEPSFTVSILSRANSTSTFPSNIKVVKTDYTHASLVSAFKGQDAVVSAVGSFALAIQTDMVDAAVEADVKRFIPGEFGNDTTNEKALARVAFFHGKKAVADHLRKTEDKMAWTGMITGPFFDWGLKAGFLGFDLQKQSATLYHPGHDQPFSTTTLGDIGLAVARSLLPKYNAQTKNQYVFVRSITTTQDEILAAFEKVTGKSWSKNPVELEPLVADATEKAKNGDFSGFAPIILGATWDPECGMNFDKRGVVANESLGTPSSRSIEELVKAVL